MMALDLEAGYVFAGRLYDVLRAERLAPESVDALYAQAPTLHNIQSPSGAEVPLAMQVGCNRSWMCFRVVFCIAWQQLWLMTASAAPVRP